MNNTPILRMGVSAYLQIFIMLQLHVREVKTLPYKCKQHFKAVLQNAARPSVCQRTPVFVRQKQGFWHI